MEFKELYRASLGKTKADLVFKNANVVNVFTEEILKADVAVTGDTIVGVGQYEGITEIPCSNRYLCPGFIDAHMHIESTTVLPNELAKEIVKNGTTAVIADAHEMVNVCGGKAISFLLDAAKGIPLDVYMMIPSSVPATCFETNGSDFTAEEISTFVNSPNVLGLGEVMCYVDVLHAKDDIIKKIELFQDKLSDGHAPGLTNKELQAYACAGIRTEHECSTFAEAYEKCQAGLKILVREGSAARNLETIVKGLLETKLPLDRFLFCTDDKHFGDIEKEGHINYNVKKAIELGMNPISAIKMASYHVANTYGLKRAGAIAPGYLADFIILNNLENLDIHCVYKGGKLVNDNLFSSVGFQINDESMLHTVHFQDITEAKLSLKVGEKNHVIECVPYQILTNHLLEALPQTDGYFIPDSIYSKLCVVERHRNSGNVGVAPLKGIHITNGAIATTVAHDSHNIIVVGDNDRDMIAAVNRLGAIQGGYVITSNGEVLAELPLPIAGLISIHSGSEVNRQLQAMLQIARKIGIPEYIDPFTTLSFLALPVIPQLRLTDLGLFDVEQFSFV